VVESTLAVPSGSSVDYLSDRLLASYFEAREHESYYNSLKHVETRRDFHDTIIPVLMDFVGEALSHLNTADLDAVIEAAAMARKVMRPTHDVVAEAKRLHPVGFDLLGLGENLSLDSLKSGYRKAARRYHPDAGGSHEEMIRVNEAYSLIHELLCQSRFSSDLTGSDEASIIGSDFPVKTTKDYIYVIGLLLLDIKNDEWALDDAHYWLAMLCTDEWMDSSFARYPHIRSRVFFACDSLAGLLWAAGRKDEAEQDRKLAEQVGRSLDREGSLHGLRYYSIEKYIEQGEKPRIVLNHRRQADNALRLGLIDEKRYKKTIDRLGGKKEEARGRDEAFQRYLSDVGFLSDLPTDRVALGKTSKVTLVPEPGWFDERLESLTDDQQAEYLRAFERGTNLGLVAKYGQVRLTSLLRSMILEPDHVSLSTIERECRALSTINGRGKDDIYSPVADVVQALDRMDKNERQERLAILRQLDERSSDGNVTTITLNLAEGSATTNHVDSAFRARPTTEYLERVRAPLTRLRRALQTGSIKTEQEKAREREVWNRDMELIRSLSVKESRSALFQAGDIEKDDPETYLKMVEAHCEMLLEMGHQMEHVEQLQVGYWIDRLTVALVRLKRWEEAERRLDAFFALPDKYRGRSSPSDLESLSKRLQRCRKMLAR
jgi:hypothetical protein